MAKKTGSKTPAGKANGAGKLDGRADKKLDELQRRIAELEAEAKSYRDRLLMYEQLLDSVRDMVFVKNGESQIIFANKAMCDLYGMSQEQIRGIVDSAVNPQEYTNQYLVDDAYVMDTGNTLVIPEEPVTRYDGLVRMFETIKSPVRDASGKVHLMVGISRDITDRALLEEDRKRAEKALGDTERLFRQMAESMRDVFWMATPDFQSFVYVSPAYETCWGRPCKELLQDPHSWWSVVLPADRPELTRKFEDLIKAGDGNFSHEFRIMRPDGVRWIWVRTFPIFNEHGDLMRIGGITQDITERKDVERRVNEFNSMVSHELRTPLTSIRAALGLIEGEQTKGPAETMDLIHIARIESDRMTRLINDLLDIKKIESDKLELKMEQLAPLEIVEAVLSSQRVTTESNIAMRADVSANDRFMGDRDRIIQVLTNLLANALKFSPKNSEVVIGVSCVDGNIRFAVTDHGPGISEGEQEKLFVPFQQVDSSDSRAKGGTGLGLAISKAIVIKHGGRIGFDTKSGAGSTFWFELPIRQTLR